MKQSTNIELKCRDCGNRFIFTAGEQLFYVGKGWTPPKRCKPCRNKRKEISRAKQQTQDAAELKNLIKEFHAISKDDIPHDAEHTLFIIGNGFDLMHDVQSSYRHFRNSIGKNNPLRHALDNYLKVKEWWADFEDALAHLDVGRMRNDATVDLWLDIFDAYGPNAKASDFFMTAETVMEPARLIAQALPRRFRMWVESLSVQTDERPLQEIITNSKVLCFNYTEFIENLYGVSHGNICYIHGCRKKQKGHPKEKLILGHQPVWKYEGEFDPRKIDCLRSSGRGDLMDVLYETTADSLIWYDEETTKDCASIIQAHRKFFDSLQQITNIVVIGHSMSPVDWDYFQEVNRTCPNAHWYVGYYGVNDVRNCSNLMEYLGITEDNLALFAT